MFILASKLYLISPPQIDVDEFSQKLEACLTNGNIALFQLRLKNLDAAAILNAAEKLIPICRKYSVPFILNDSALLALECGADGVHIGDEDCSVAEAREIIGNKTLGVSCYNSTDRALESAQAGADIISFGAFFPTTTKTPKSKAEIGTVNRLRAAQPSAKISAIGGITPQNCAPLIAAGVDYLCVISYIWNHPISPEKAIAEFSEILSAG